MARPLIDTTGIHDGVNARKVQPSDNQRLADHEDLESRSPQELPKAFDNQRYCAVSHRGQHRPTMFFRGLGGDECAATVITLKSL